MSFVHLHVHTQYSMLEASCRLQQLCARAAEWQMPALAITDHGNMFGAIEFYFAAQKHGIRPIIGLDAYIAPKGCQVRGEDPEAAKMPNRRIVLLAKNFEGYRELCQISTIGYQKGFYYKPRVDYDVLSQFNKNVIALSGGLRGEIPFTFLNQGAEAAEKKVDQWLEIYGENFYLELNRTGRQEWQDINPFLCEMAQKKGIPVVAANDVHYFQQEDQLAQEVLVCIGSNKTLQDEGRFRLGTDQFYFKSPQEMKELFKDIPEAIDNTVKIAEQCEIEFKLQDEDGRAIYHLPTYPTKQGCSVSEEMKRIAYEGLQTRFEQAAQRGEPIEEEEKPNYYKRLEHELHIINKMGFEGYFLIVQDFINWAKDNDVPVGPGRGSGAGSLVAYSLAITDLDPLRNGLIFERFLNPERISMPDFDIDFCQDKRGLVIDYVTEKYGAESVAQIITYGRLQARVAIRDVGRVLGMTYSEVDVVAKLVPDKLGITLKEAIEQEPRLRELMEMDPKVSMLMDLAQKIEGLVRHAGIHAAGVIIADDALVRHAPLYKSDKGEDSENVVQYDMKHSEKIGLIKFDFLGLKTLTHIKNALVLLEKNRELKMQPEDIPMSDAGIYDIMAKGDTLGIFQFEGEGMRDVIKKIRPNCFADIVAINALYRPGPMDMIPEYTRRKHGLSKVEYLFPELEEILKETYGVILYQEQVQLIAARIANYSLGEADMLRRAMGKKIAEEMAKQQKRFLEGAAENGYDAEKAEQLFDLMAEFAKYGFNKSHAAAYCVIAAQTAWLKNYYPVEFFAALLTTEMSDTDKVVRYIKDARKRGLEVKQPDINRSAYGFDVQGEVIYFGLGAIKGVGEAAVRSILEVRQGKEGQRFEDLDDFFNSIDLRRVNKKVIECLVKAGAFDGFGVHRAKLFVGYTKYMDRAEVLRKDRERGQVSLFSIDDEAEETVELPEVAEWSRTARLAYEKEVLGFYLSDHPLSGWESFIANWARGTVSELDSWENKERAVLIGLVSQLKELITKKGTRMAFAGLEDLTGTVELVVFPEAFAKHENQLKQERPVIVEGTLDKAENGAKILVDSVLLLEDELKQTKKLLLHLNGEVEQKLSHLHELFSKYQGGIPYTFQVALPEIKKVVELEVEQGQGIRPEYEFFEDLYRTCESTDWVDVYR